VFTASSASRAFCSETAFTSANDINARMIASAPMVANNRWLISILLLLVDEGSVQEVFRKFNALEFQKLNIRVNPAIQRHSDLPRPREHFCILNRGFIH